MDQTPIHHAILSDGTLSPAVLTNGRYTAGGFMFDRANGLGSVPDVENIAYMGAVVLMEPRQYLAYLGEGARQASVEFVLKVKPRLATPYIDIRIDPDSRKCTVVGHEGRARMTAIMQSDPEALVPVALFIKEGFFPLRNRHLEPWMFETINDGLWSQPGEERSRLIDGKPLLGVVYEDKNGEIVTIDYRETYAPRL